MGIIICLISAYYAKTYKQAFQYAVMAQVIWSLIVLPFSLEAAKRLQSDISTDTIVVGMIMGVIRTGLVAMLFLWVKKRVVAHKRQASKEIQQAED